MSHVTVSGVWGDREKLSHVTVSGDWRVEGVGKRCHMLWFLRFGVGREKVSHVTVYGIAGEKGKGVTCDTFSLHPQPPKPRNRNMSHRKSIRKKEETI